jgi:hypothetical protein
MANYRVSTNTNSSNETAQDKKKVNLLRLFNLKHDLLKISIDLRTALAADTHLAEGATERGKITYVPSGNTKTYSFHDRGQYLVPHKA